LALIWIFVIEKLANLCCKEVSKKDPESNNQKDSQKITSLPNDILPKTERIYDLIIVGATGFTGKLLCEYYAKNYGLSDKFKWAIAGRSKDRLQKVKDQ